MGLLDQVIGGVVGNVLGGGRGAPTSQGGGRGGGGLGDMIGNAASSPLVKALLLLLAAKAATGGFGDILGHGRGSAPQNTSPAPDPRGSQGGGFMQDNPFKRGGAASNDADNPYGDLAGGFDRPGGAPDSAQGSLGGALGGGLGGLIDSFQRSGHGDAMNSWVGSGQNQPMRPDQLADALGPSAIDNLSRQTGMSRDDLLNQLSQVLPGVIDKLTPQGRPPTPDEQRHW